ncbi:MAG: 2,3-bisphosphoglycerate-independent phosphoglycerate mutase [Candidatus Pacebacteria bacterium]|nr:2,3-bisphosphoglycerate-independent phosphoglycerate mutase [Candidatus Paceibacterota bacterium]
MKRQVILVVLDGWGIGAKDITNPINVAKTPNIDFIRTHYLTGSLQASGIAVGLPWKEEGNSEVGHLTLGSGKIIYQHYPRITISIQDGSFFKNKVLLDAAEHVKKNNSALNLIGLLTDANIHASVDHIVALIKFANENKVPKVNIHLYTDGKDSPPRSSLKILQKINPLLSDTVKIASVSGRHYAMDRDGHWDRTQKAYDVLTGNGEFADSAEKLIEETHNEGLNDPFVKPHMIGPENNCVKDNDAIVFFDFREDSVRQIVSAFVVTDFKEFPVKKFNNVYIATMTQYLDKFNVPVISPQEKIENPLGKILADNGKVQLRIAETEKYAHVTYFFNGLNEKPYDNEFRILVPSRNVSNHAEHPEMMASEITSRIIQSMEDGAYDFILANYANGDLVAHTGNFDAALIAVKTLDEEMGKLAQKAVERGDILIITSDHGNVEKMADPLTAEPLTGHDLSPVPIYMIAKEFQSNKTIAEAELIESETIGILSDVAPTILEIMDLPKPKTMTGQSLFGFLK